MHRYAIFAVACSGRIGVHYEIGSKHSGVLHVFVIVQHHHRCASPAFVVAAIFVVKMIDIFMYMSYMLRAQLTRYTSDNSSMD